MQRHTTNAATTFGILGYTVLSQESKMIYNVNNNTFEYYVFTDYRLNDDGLLERKEGKYEIK
jgi:hypothetical protein